MQIQDSIGLVPEVNRELTSVQTFLAAGTHRIHTAIRDLPMVWMLVDTLSRLGHSAPSARPGLSL